MKFVGRIFLWRADEVHYNERGLDNSVLHM